MSEGAIVLCQIGLMLMIMGISIAIASLDELNDYPPREQPPFDPYR